MYIITLTRRDGLDRILEAVGNYQHQQTGEDEMKTLIKIIIIVLLALLLKSDS